MKNPLACADFTFPLLEHDHVLQLIGQLGFDGVDIGLFEGRSHLQPSTEFRNPEKSGKRLAEKLVRHQLKPADIYLQIAPDFISFASNHFAPSKRKKARDRFLQTLDYTRACGGTHVSALPGAYFPEESKEKSWAKCIEELTWRSEQARAANCVFSVEAHVGSIVPNPLEALRLVKNVPGLTLTLDYTHFTLGGMPDRQVEPLISHASHFHLRGARRKHLQTSKKDNTINYNRILQVMKKTGYKGYIGVEYVWTEWQHCNEVDNLSETILWRDFLRKEMKRI
jgi:sugar phosphate isomerase/epimerase